MNDFLDDLSLPKTNSNEDLETISRHKLALIFEPSIFELRDESQRDKGIDLIVEVKKNGRYSNYRFAVQLKATSNKINSDSSISFSIDVSNINYLMNYSGQSFYILYHHPSQQFFYDSVAEVYQDLNKKYSNGEFPKSLSVKFFKPFDVTGIEAIYKETIKRGAILRQVNNYLQVQGQQENPKSSIIIDSNEVFSVGDKIRAIEECGHVLLNKSQFGRLKDLEAQCYSNQELSAKFHFVCGQAHYYTSSFFKALDHFKKAITRKAELSRELQAMLEYYTESARFSLGMIDETRFNKTISQLMESEYLGLFLKMEKAYTDYTEDVENPGRLTLFYETIGQIKTSPVADESLLLIADANILKVEGSELTDDLWAVLSQLNALPNSVQILSLYKDWKDKHEAYNRHVEEIRTRGINQGYFSTVNNISFEAIRTKSLIIVLSAVIPNYDLINCKPGHQLTKNDIELINELCTILEKIANSYHNQNAIENELAAISVKFELLHFSQQLEAVEETTKYLFTQIDIHELYGIKPKVEALISGGTMHEKLYHILRSQFEKINDEKAEVEKINSMIVDIDTADVNITAIDYSSCYQIQLVPLGFFGFPKSELDNVLKIISVNEPKVRDQFLNLWNMGFIPVANIFSLPIKSEGPGQGFYEFKGLKSIENVYRIRKAFFDNKYYKFDPFPVQ